MPGEEEEMVEETEEEEEDEEEDGLEYETNTPSKDLYMTPPSTGGHSKPSLAPSHSPTPADSNPENNVVLYTEELEAHIEVFLEEAEEDMEMNDLPPLENITPLLIPAPTICHRTLFLLVFSVHFRPNFTPCSLPHFLPL